MSNKENTQSERDDWISRVKNVEQETKKISKRQNVFQEVLIEFMHSKTIDKNDKTMLTLFTDRTRYFSDKNKFFKLMSDNNVFIECARFWILWSLQLSDKERQLEKIDEGLKRITRGSESANLQKYKTKISMPAKKKTVRDMYFWSKENKIISFGTADEKDKTIRMNQTKKIMDFTGKEISSIEELKSKKWSDAREANALQLRVTELENRLKQQEKELALPSPNVPNSANKDYSKPVESLLSNDSFMIETPAIPKIHEKCSGGGFTENLSTSFNLQSQKTVQNRLEDPSSASEFTQPTLSEASSLLTPVQKKPRPKLEVFQEDHTLVLNNQPEISEAISYVDCLTPIHKSARGNHTENLNFETTGTEALTPVSKPMPKPFGHDDSVEFGPGDLNKTSKTQPMTTPINLREDKNPFNALTPQRNEQMSGFTEQLRTDSESLLSFTPTRQQEESFKKPTLAFNIDKTPERSDAAKRDASHLTPLGNRFRPKEPTSVGSDTRPPITPTGIVNNVNALMNDFFAPTTAFTPSTRDKSIKFPKKDDTRNFMDMFTKPIADSPDFHQTVQKKKISVPKFVDNTLDILASPGPSNHNPAATLSAFDVSLDENAAQKPMSETQRIRSEEEMTFGFAKVDPTIIMFAAKTTDFNSMKTGVFEPPKNSSTRCVRLSRSVAEAKGPLNPWSKQFVDMQMDEMDIEIDSKDTKFLPKMSVSVQGHEFKHVEMVGEGNFAKVYRYESATGGDVAVKVQKESEPWEYAILAEVQELLKGSCGEESVLKLISFTKYPNCGVMVTPYYVNGTLLSLCAQAKPLLATRAVSMKPFILFFAAQLTALLVELHSKDIIHGDFKPDNVMLLPIDSFDSAFGEKGKIQGVCLIDWGRSINCGVYSGTFKGKCYTSGFMCGEMVKNEPWRFQVDLYALAMSLHIIMFGDYAKVNHSAVSTNTTLSSVTIPRHFDRRVWTEIFNSLMNYKSLENPVDMLREKRDYFAQEYKALTEREKQNFQDHYTRHLNS